MELIQAEELLTKDQFKAALPKEARLRVTDEMVDHINDLISQPDLRENFRDNLIGYSMVLGQGKYKLMDYINAVKFVSYKMLGSSAMESYAKTFPERYQKLIDEGADNNTISAYSSAYNKNQLVNKIFEQTLVPTHILNADLFQKAINVQATLMMTAKSEKVRSDAAAKLMDTLKPPETKKVELNVSTNEDKSINELRESTMALVAQQRKMLEAGMSDAKGIAHSKLVGEVVSDE